MPFSRLLLLLILDFVTASQPSAPSAVPATLRPLPWGQLNFLHTTDTHGWHAGHLREPQYSADWGDYISFASHLRKRADRDGSDLLLIDTGDRVEGNGLYDASDPQGKYTFDIVERQHIDLITVGNHELYKNTTSAHEYDKFLPEWKGNYLTSNLNITDEKTGESTAFGPRYRKFTTKNQGIRVLAMGFIYDFRGNANNTQVQRVEDTIKESWFQDAIRNRDVDLFLIAGHVALRGFPNAGRTEYDLLYDAIRREQWDTPIVFFGGHTHIRDFKHYGQSTEKKAYGIESGRYMETIGFLSMTGVKSQSNGLTTEMASPKYERLYIDNNLYSLQHHSNTTAKDFDTEAGKNATKAIAAARKALDLDKTYGCAPRDYLLYRAPYPGKNSIISLLEEKILPNAFEHENSSATPAIVMTNTGAVRFDVFEGPFTVDTTYQICPFTSAFRQIRGVDYELANQVMKRLNSGGPILYSDDATWLKRDDLLPKPPQQAIIAKKDDFAISPSDQQPLLETTKPSLTPGYTTKDDVGSDGDDTIHSPLEFYNIPNIVGANIGFKADKDDLPKTVDLVFNEYIQRFVLAALREMGVSYGPENTRIALDGRSLTGIIEGWVKENWPCHEKK